MARYRYVEKPQGVWTVQRKGWFFWHDMFFLANREYMARRGIGTWYDDDDIFSFKSLDEARAAVATATTAMAYCRIVLEESNG